MKSVTALYAKIHFASVLDRVAAGEEIVITRRGKPVARIVPEVRTPDERMRQAVERILAMRTKMAARKGFRPISDAEIKSAISEGRFGN